MPAEIPTMIAPEPRRSELLALASGAPSWTVAGEQLADLEALMSGFLHPARGYAERRNDGGPCGELSPSLDVSGALADQAAPGSLVALKDPEGVLLGVLRVAERWEEGGRWHLAGPVEGIELPAHDDFAADRHTPGELARLARSGAHRAVLAYFPRRVLHAATRAALVAAAERLDAAILLLIPSAAGEDRDTSEFARLHALQVSAGLLPGDRTTTGVVPVRVPAEARAAALRMAAVARNCGASHYAADEAPVTSADIQALHACERKLGIRIVPVRPWAYDRGRRTFVDPDISPAAEVERPLPDDVLLSWPTGGVPDWLLTPSELKAMQRAFAPRRAQGFTVFLTGLSGSGKSTIARALRVKLMERTWRPVTLLDGDRVRRHLSSELGFSREHRNLNILRIGWVASEITRHGGIAICAPIAPYDEIRRQVREMIEPAGGFLLVHVSTPLETCEARDRKGLYAKARAGQLPQFTGVSDPYEAPADAALAIDTRHTTVEQACGEIIDALTAAGYLEPVR
jgi:sulfate adenylyltransferase